MNVCRGIDKNNHVLVVDFEIGSQFKPLLKMCLIINLQTIEKL